MEKVFNTMYSKLPNLVLGFHGCSSETFQKVLFNHQKLNQSTNTYDGLGNGIYFWENSYQRAYDWARQNYKNSGKVIGAVIDLGYCLNLTDYTSTDILKMGYELLKIRCSALDIPLPSNKKGRSKTDLLIRDLDCAVIQQLHEYNRKQKLPQYDSVRGVFIEGKEIYPNSGLLKKRISNCVLQIRIALKDILSRWGG